MTRDDEEAFRILGDHHDAEDLVHLVNRGVNQRRARKVRQTEPLDSGVIDAEQAEPAVDAERASLRAAIAGAMATLSERERLIIQLREVAGFTGEEIAAMLGIPTGTVRWHLHQARRHLQARLAVNQESR